MRSKLRNLYEEEAATKGDNLLKIYDNNSAVTERGFTLLARYFLKLKQLWLEKIVTDYAKAESLILDAGCGTGYLSGGLAPDSRSIFGVDIALNYLKIASLKIKNKKFVQSDIAELPFRNNIFDIVVCSEIPEHVEDVDKVLIEIRRVLKVGVILY